MAEVEKKLDAEEVHSLYKKGDKVFLKKGIGIDPGPYEIHGVLPGHDYGHEYRLSRDGFLKSRVFQEEDLQTTAQEFLEKVEQTPSLYKKGDTVFLKGDTAVYSGPYEIHEVLANHEYHLSRDGVLKTKVYQEEDLQTRTQKFLEKVEQTPSLYNKGDTVWAREFLRIGHRLYKIHDVLADHEYRLSRDGVLERRIYREADLRFASESSSSDEPRLYSGYSKAKEYVQNTVERDTAFAGSSTKSIRLEAIGSDPSIAHEKTELDGSKARSDKIKMEDIGEEKAENIRPATGKAKELDDTGPSFSEVDDDDVPEEVSATDDQPATGKAKELDDFGAYFSELDDNDTLEEVSAQDDQLIRQQSREEAKTQNLRCMLSRFGLGERPLVDGKKRVRWRCGCGRKCYDDFTELRSGAAAELEKWLNNSMRKHAGSSASNCQQTATLTSAVSPNAGSSGYQQTAESDISLQSLGPSANVRSAWNMNAAASIDVNLEKCWLILCGNMKRGPDVLLTQMNLSSTPSDKSLFDDMKSVYSNFKQSWTLRSFLRSVKTIRFVQFQLHKSARVDIRKAPDMPPVTRRDEYLYEPCDLMPPVGEDFMTHWFHHPEDAWEFPWAYSLIPKRLKGELEVNLNQAPRVGWGIQIVEGWLGSRLWLLSLSLFVCGSLAFAICWKIFEHDIQGAFAVSAYVVSLLTLAVGAAQANLG